MNIVLSPLIHTLDNTTNSYKLYWFLGIVKTIQTTDQREFNIEDIILEMLVESWFHIKQYRLSFGYYDQLPVLITTIQQEIGIPDKITKPQVRKLLFTHRKSSSIQNAIKTLSIYVPYRFISSWFKSELTLVPDHKKNQLIYQLSKTNSAVFYYFSNTCKIVFNESWVEYVYLNAPILIGFVTERLVHYLQNRNPNTPNIISKVRGTTKRDLTKAKKFWTSCLKSKGCNFRCIYSGESMTEFFSIDHFIPWNFLAHDEIWNTIPTFPIINSIKNDKLPSKVYFERFIESHFDAFHFIYENEKNAVKYLEDYVDLFKMDLHCIYTLTYEDFHKAYMNTLLPISQIASNMGFEIEWKFFENDSIKLSKNHSS